MNKILKVNEKEIEEAKNIEQYLREYKPKGWEIPLSSVSNVPGINPVKIKYMRRYFNKNPLLDDEKDERVLAELQPHTKFNYFYIEALRSYFKEHLEKHK